MLLNQSSNTKHEDKEKNEDNAREPKINCTFSKIIFALVSSLTKLTKPPQTTQNTYQLDHELLCIW